MNFLSIIPLVLLLVGCQTSQQKASQTANDIAPQPIYRVAPSLPPELEEQEVEGGDAVIELVVGPMGGVLEANVASTTHPSFGEASLQAVFQWRFVPDSRNGVPVAFRMRIPFKFSIAQEPKVSEEQDGLSNDG